MNRIISLIKQNNEIKNAGWIIGEQICQMAIGFIVSILSARYLGPTNYGTLTYTASFVSFVMSVSTLGMEGVVIKKLISNPNDEGAYLGTCMLFRLFSSLLSSVCIVIIVIILNPIDQLKWLLVSLQSFQLIFRSVFILDSWFQRHLKSRYVSIGKIIASIIVSAYKIYLLVTHKNIVWFAVTNAMFDLIVALVLYAFYRYENGQKLSIEKNKGYDVLKESYHFIISGLMVAIYSQMDRIMIGNMMSDYDVGLYSTATAICGMWVFVPTAIINSFRPKILELKQIGDDKQFEKRLEQLYSSIIWLCISVSLLICFFSTFIIRTLYGDSYIRAANALRIAIWFETFSMIGTARGIWILSENKNKFVKYYLGIGAVVNLLLNCLMIPSWGIEGAAFATLITQITTSILAPCLFRETRHHTQIVLRSFAMKWYFEQRKGDLQ